MRIRVPLALLASAAGLTAVTALVPASTAGATPPSGVTAETLAELELAPSLLPPRPPGHPPIGDEAEVTLRRIVIAPGGSTGWHHHGGHVQGLVASGTLTRILADCTRDVSPAGTWVTEEPGGDHVGLNLGPDPVVLLVTYVTPDDAPLSTDAPARCS